MSTVPNASHMTGVVVGTGAALNVSVGFVPRVVEIYNCTDGDIITREYLDYRVPFTSGGANGYQVLPNDLLVGITSGARIRIAEVVLISGSWAAGTAAGTFIVRADDGLISGTMGSETVSASNSGLATAAATVTAAVNTGFKIDTATAGVVTTSAVSPYLGSVTAAAGFTIGSVVSENAKELRWVAYR